MKNFDDLVLKLKANLRLDTPDTFPHVDSHSFRFEPNDGWGRASILYDVIGTNGHTLTVGAVVVETDTPGVWQLL